MKMTGFKAMYAFLKNTLELAAAVKGTTLAKTAQDVLNDPKVFDCGADAHSALFGTSREDFRIALEKIADENANILPLM